MRTYDIYYGTRLIAWVEVQETGPSVWHVPPEWGVWWTDDLQRDIEEAITREPHASAIRLRTGYTVRKRPS